MSNRLAAVITIGYAVVADFVVSLGLPPLVAIFCLTPLVLFAPGYACVLACDLAADSRLPGRRVVLGVAISMGCVALGGLVLNALGPLDRVSWTEWLVGLTCTFAIAALARDLYKGGRFSISRPGMPQEWRMTLSWPLAAAAIVVILALIAATTLTEQNSHSAYDKPVTQLSLLPIPGPANESLRLTVTNLSSRSQRVSLTIARGNGPPETRALVVPAAKTWSRMEPASASGVRAALTLPGGQHAFSQVSWNG